jgi:hypothetical protein
MTIQNSKSHTWETGEYVLVGIACLIFRPFPQHPPAFALLYFQDVLVLVILLTGLGVLLLLLELFGELAD